MYSTLNVHIQDSPSFRPYPSQKHSLTRARYITSNDPRGYLVVYEYPLNGQWLMVDADNSYVLWTGIWKALGNAKADIIPILESQDELATQFRRVRGGYLKIQGTWVNYEIALRLARRVAWPIREDLVPIFGPTFPSTCLAPGQPGYGQLSTSPRKSRRKLPSLPLRPETPPPWPDSPHILTLRPTSPPVAPMKPTPFLWQPQPPSTASVSSQTPKHQHRYTPYVLPSPVPPPHPRLSPPLPCLRTVKLPPILTLVRSLPPTASDVLKRLKEGDDGERKGERDTEVRGKGGEGCREEDGRDLLYTAGSGNVRRRTAGE